MIRAAREGPAAGSPLAEMKLPSPLPAAAVTAEVALHEVAAATPAHDLYVLDRVNRRGTPRNTATMMACRRGGTGGQRKRRTRGGGCAMDRAHRMHTQSHPASRNQELRTAAASPVTATAGPPSPVALRYREQKAMLAVTARHRTATRWGRVTCSAGGVREAPRHGLHRHIQTLVGRVWGTRTRTAHTARAYAHKQVPHTLTHAHTRSHTKRSTCRAMPRGGARDASQLWCVRSRCHHSNRR
jgi:hypothetical protein